MRAVAIQSIRCHTSRAEHQQSPQQPSSTPQHHPSLCHPAFWLARPPRSRDPIGKCCRNKMMAQSPGKILEAQDRGQRLGVPTSGPGRAACPALLPSRGCCLTPPSPRSAAGRGSELLKPQNQSHLRTPCRCSHALVHQNITKSLCCLSLSWKESQKAEK